MEDAVDEYVKTQFGKLVADVNHEIDLHENLHGNDPMEYHRSKLELFERDKKKHEEKERVVHAARYHDGDRSASEEDSDISEGEYERLPRPGKKFNFYERIKPRKFVKNPHKKTDLPERKRIFWGLNQDPHMERTLLYLSEHREEVALYSEMSHAEKQEFKQQVKRAMLNPFVEDAGELLAMWGWKLEEDEVRMELVNIVYYSVYSQAVSHLPKECLQIEYLRHDREALYNAYKKGMTVEELHEIAGVGTIGKIKGILKLEEAKEKALKAGFIPDMRAGCTLEDFIEMKFPLAPRREMSTPQELQRPYKPDVKRYLEVPVEEDTAIAGHQFLIPDKRRGDRFKDFEYVDNEHRVQVLEKPSGVPRRSKLLFVDIGHRDLNMRIRDVDNSLRTASYAERKKFLKEIDLLQGYPKYNYETKQ